MLFNNDNFKPVNEIKELTDKYYECFPKKIKDELYESLPRYIEAHASRGEHFVPYFTGRFSTFSSTFYIEVIKEVGKVLKDKGYHVEAFLFDTEEDYNNILCIISWDFKKVKNSYTANRHYLRLIRKGISIEID